MSIPINIAEGFGRFSAKEKAHFIQISFGSINEVMCELELAFDEGYINQEQLRTMESMILSVKKQLATLHKTILNNGDAITTKS